MIQFAHLILLVGYFSVATPLDSGPLGPIIIYDVMKCEEDVNTVSLDVKFFQGSEHKQITASATTTMDIDENTMVTLRGHKFNNGNWERDAYLVEDKPFLSLLTSFIGPIWTNLRNKLEPPITDPSFIPAGTYHLNEFYTDDKGVSIPALHYGRYMAEVHVSVDDEEIVCLASEIEFKPPTSGFM